MRGFVVFEPTDNSEYQLMSDEYGVLRHLWYGEKVGMSMDYLCKYPDVGFSGNIYEAEKNQGSRNEIWFVV